MSRRGGNSASRNERGSEWKERLHRVDFSLEDELAAQEWATANKPAWDTCLEELVDNAWSVRVSPPTSGDDYWVSATCKDEKADYGGHTFSVVYPDYQTGTILLFWYITSQLEPGLGGDFSAGKTRAWLQT